MRESVTRRGALKKGAAASIAAVAVASVPAKASAQPVLPNRHRIRVGRLIRIDSPRTAAIVAPDKSVIQVVLSDSATIKRGLSGSVADLTPFVLGEEVVVIGAESGSVITASQVSSVYRSMTGKVLADNGAGFVSTTAGPLYLRPHIRARANVNRLAHGQKFSAETWDAPASGRHEAFIFRSENT
jgi:hypothetical protein